MTPRKKYVTSADLFRWMKFFAGLVAALLLLRLAVGFACRCLTLIWPLALLPALLVLVHVLLTLLRRPRQVGQVSLDIPCRVHVNPSTGSSQPSGNTSSGGPWKEFEDINHDLQTLAKQLRHSIGERYSNPGILLVRFGVPGALLLLVSSALLLAVTAPDATWLHPGLHANGAFKDQAERLTRGLLYGAAGAYVWVLLELGERSFRRDVTTGSVLWCSVALILGPVLGALVALVAELSAKDVAGAGKPNDAGGLWQSAVVLFFAGFAPRRIIDAVIAAAQQLLRFGPAPAAPSRLVPLGLLRGMTPQVEERLRQEGIYDVHTLGAADAVRLIRNTPYDVRQIVSWMDQALLVVFSPKHQPALEDYGITGAIDLAWCHLLSRCREVNRLLAEAGETQAEREHDDTDVDPFEALAQGTQLPMTALRDLARRLFYDEQVRMVWVLYNALTSQPADTDGTDAQEPPGEHSRRT